MTCVRIPDGIICFSDPTDYCIEVGGKTYRFEWHSYSGPARVKENGEIHGHQPMAFLRAASLWNLQGRRVENGMCVWHEPRQPVTEMRGRRRVIVEPGEEGWDW